MPTSNVSAVTIPAGTAALVVPADQSRTYLRCNNSSLADLTFSISQAAAQTFKGWRNTGAQADFELDDYTVGALVQSAFWVFNNSSVAANVSIIQGYRN